MVRVAHISDTHVLPPQGVQWREMFNLYEIDHAGAHIEAHVVDPAGGSFRRTDVAMRSSCI